MTSLATQIKILRADQLYPMEWLIREPEHPIDLTELSFIRNPFLVTPLENDNFLLLQDVEFYHNLVTAGLRHIPVQIVADKNIFIRAKKIGLINYQYENLRQLAIKYPSQIILNENPVTNGTEYLSLNGSFREGENLKIYLRNSTRGGCPVPLDLLFRHILSYGRYVSYFESSVNEDNIFRSVEISGVLEIPAFSLSEFQTAALTGHLFPPFVNDICTQSRVLNIDFPLSVLTSDRSIEEKDAFLKDLISLREQSNKTTFFEGQIYLLNR